MSIRIRSGEKTGRRKTWYNKAPKDINHTFGYRTKRSMMNKDTWSFAHAYIGKLWLICGLVLMPIPGSGSKEFLFCIKMYCEM